MNTENAQQLKIRDLNVCPTFATNTRTLNIGTTAEGQEVHLRNLYVLGADAKIEALLRRIVQK